LNLILATLIFDEDKEVQSLLFDEKKIFAERTNYANALIKSLKEKENPKEFEINRYELACFRKIIVKGCDCVMDNLFEKIPQSFYNALQFVQNKKPYFYSILSHEKKELLISIFKDIPEYNSILKKLRISKKHKLLDDDVNVDIINQLKTTIINKLLNHLGIINADYEIYDERVIEFFEAYSEGIYFKKIIEKMAKLDPIRIDVFYLVSKQVLSHLKNDYKFGKKEKYEFEIPTGLIIGWADGSMVKLTDEMNDTTENRLLLLLNLFRKNEHSHFFESISYIDSKMWMYKSDESFLHRLVNNA
jgi:hypothetical protein